MSYGAWLVLLVMFFCLYGAIAAVLDFLSLVSYYRKLKRKNNAPTYHLVDGAGEPW